MWHSTEFLAVIPPVFSVTWSSRNNSYADLLSVLKMLCCLISFLLIFDKYKSKKNHFFKIEIFSNNISFYYHFLSI